MFQQNCLKKDYKVNMYKNSNHIQAKMINTLPILELEFSEVWSQRKYKCEITNAFKIVCFKIFHDIDDLESENLTKTLN